MRLLHVHHDSKDSPHYYDTIMQKQNPGETQQQFFFGTKMLRQFAASRFLRILVVRRTRQKRREEKKSGNNKQGTEKWEYRWLNKIGKLASQNGAHKSALGLLIFRVLLFYFLANPKCRSRSILKTTKHLQRSSTVKHQLATSNVWKIIKEQKEEEKKRKARPCPQFCEGFFFYFFRFSTHWNELPMDLSQSSLFF